MKKNRIRICGRKVTTAPTPAIAPSTTIDRSSPAGKRRRRLPTATRPRLRSIDTGVWLQANTAWNITNMIAARMIGPSDRVEQHRVEPVGPAADRRLADHRGGRDFARSPLKVDEVALHLLMHAADRRGQHVVERGLKLGDAAAADRDGLDHRHAELVLEAASDRARARRAWRDRPC